MLAVALVAALLWYGKNDERGGAPRRTAPPGPLDPPPVGADPPVSLPLVKGGEAAQAEAFIGECLALGARAVPELLRRLRTEEEIAYRPRWVFRDGKLVEYPSRRALYLDALAAIEGAEAAEALQAMIVETESPEESYLIALALERRGSGGWERAALEKSDRAPDPARLPIQLALAEMAARASPREAAETLVARAPRGTEERDPRVLATTLLVLPLQTAAEAAGALLEDAAVTRRAKSRYIHALAGRTEWETLLRLRELCDRGGLDEPTRVEICQQAAQSVGFLNDIAEYQQAFARGEHSLAADVKGRFDRRIDEMIRLAQSALGVDLANATDLRSANLRRLLDGYRAKFAGN